MLCDVNITFVRSIAATIMIWSILLLSYGGYAGIISLYHICELMLLQETRCCGNGSDSWSVTRRALLLYADPIIFIVMVVRVPENLFLGEQCSFCGSQICHVYVCIHIFVGLLVLVSLG